MRLAILLLLAPLLASAAAADEGGARLEVGGGLSVGPAWDSNPTRRSGAAPAGDSSALLLGDVAVRWSPADRHALELRWDGGARIFGRERGQDEVVNRLAARHDALLVDSLLSTAEARLEDRRVRAGSRDSTDLAGAVGAELFPGSIVGPRIRLGLRRFDYVPDRRWSYAGPGLQLGLRVRPFPRHVFGATWEHQWLAFSGAPLEDDPAESRADRVQSLGADWTMRSRIILNAGVQLAANETNSRGNRWIRRRAYVIFGGRLPLELFLSAQGTLQLVRFPDGIRIDRQLLAEEGSENLSSLALKLSRPLGETLAAELRYQLHASTFVGEVLPYERHVAGAGLSARF